MVEDKQGQDMSDAKVLAEAILIVIKRILKWVGVSAVALLVAIGVTVGAYQTYEHYYVTVPKEMERANVVVKIGDEKCPPEFPVSVKILNSSERTVNSVTIHVKGHLPNHSTDLTAYGALESDIVIEPKKEYGNCWTKNLSYNAPAGTKPSDLIWELSRYSVVFK